MLRESLMRDLLSGKIRLLACSLFHTFYLKVSFKSIPRWEAAVACLIIAAKIENKVQSLKVITRAAAHYLRPKMRFNDKRSGNLSPKQLYHWMSQIHIRERQIMERLHGELRTVLPIKDLGSATKLCDFIVGPNESRFSPKNKHLSTVFRGCFQILRIMLRPSLRSLTLPGTDCTIRNCPYCMHSLSRFQSDIFYVIFC